MKAFPLIWFLIIGASALPTAAQEFDHSAYKDSTIAAAGSDLGIDPRVTWWFDAAHPKFHTVATFTGSFRPIQPDTKSLIDQWAIAMGHDPALARTFTSEIEVLQDGRSYWLPIQEVLVEPLRNEVAQGRQAHFYILLLGAYKLVPVFGVNEFNAIEG